VKSAPNSPPVPPDTDKGERPEVVTKYWPRSKQLWQEICRYIPGGVDSPFRSFGEVGGHTIFFNRAHGAYLYDVDGNKYIDYLGAWGPAILGHAPPNVVSACQTVIAKGAVFGAPHDLELELAKLIVEAVASVEQVRFVNSGTEAVMSAIRLARGYKKRDLIVMFEGCYHGHSDSVLASDTHSSSSGIPKSARGNTLLVPFNDLVCLEDCLRAHHKEIAGVIIEPVAGSMGVIPPQPGYLEGVRKLCTKYDALLIFDEVITGFRLAYGGAQVLYNVQPDLTCFGKALGGGMPIGAYGGSKEIMEHLLPNGDVYQAGTFSGNPVTMAGGIETLKQLSKPQIYETLESRAHQLFEGLKETCAKHSLQLSRVGSMFSILFTNQPVKNYKQSLTIDPHAYARFFHNLLSSGVYMPPSAVDAACVSAAHSENDIDQTVSLMRKALANF
jgi:glutamate-1-semialdehyde 2,1-aminomutase